MATFLEAKNEWESLIRRTRNTIDDEQTYLYDKFTRELFNYLRTHKFKEPTVFLQQSGKEYPVMLDVLERYCGGDVSGFVTKEMLHTTWDLAQRWKRLYVTPRPDVRAAR
jgi:hypothetical protein